MRRLLCLVVAVTLIILAFVGCTEKEITASMEGEWSLETISDINGEILIVGKAFEGYNDFKGEKRDISASFKENGTFKISCLEESLQGKYNEDKKHRTKNAIAISLNFDNGAKSMAAFGTRTYKDCRRTSSLIFSLDDKIYSFLK